MPKLTRCLLACLLLVVSVLIVTPNCPCEENRPAQQSLIIDKVTVLGGDSGERPIDLCSDGAGGCWLVIEACSNFAVGMNSVRGKKRLARCLAYMNKEGRWLWVKDLKSPDEDGSERFGVCSVPGGFCWVAGVERGKKKKDDIPSSLFYTKYDSSGKDVVDELIRTENGVDFYAIAPSRDGGCWLCADIKGVAKIDKITIKPDYKSLPVIMKIGPSGEVTSIERIAASGEYEIVCMAPDNRGGCWIAGNFSEKIAFDKMLLEAEGAADVFVVYINSGGKFERASTSYGTDELRVVDMCPDGSGGVWVAGNFSGSAHIGESDVTAQHKSEVFVQKMLVTGTWGPQFIASEEGDLVNNCAAVCPDGDGGCMLAFNRVNALSIRSPGVKHSSVLLMLGTAANKTREMQFDETGLCLEKMACDSRDMLWLTGTFMDKCKIGEKTFWSRGSNDIFLSTVLIKQ